MPRSLLPPRGIEIPAAMLYDRNISPAVRDTWAQLRGMAWGQNDTPELSVPKLAEMLNKSQSTIYEHMRLLRDLECLSWQTTEKKTIIVHFPETDFINNALSEKSEKLIYDHALDSTGDPETRAREDSRIANFRKVGMNNPRKPDTVSKEILSPIVDALSAVTRLDKKLNYARLAREAKTFHLAGYTAEHINGIYGAGGKWFTDDWRGKKGQLPNTANIRETIKTYVNGAAKDQNDRRRFITGKYSDLIEH